MNGFGPPTPMSPDGGSAPLPETPLSSAWLAEASLAKPVIKHDIDWLLIGPAPFVK
jgi:hypothetical protein